MKRHFGGSPHSYVYLADRQWIQELSDSKTFGFLQMRNGGKRINDIL